MTTMTEQLSPHFTFAELTASQWAARAGVRNEPDCTPAGLAIMGNLRRLASVLELVRYALGTPVLVSSGYRGELVNRNVGGASTSAHLLGLAADFTSPAFGAPHAVGVRILDVPAIQFDQLIHEYGAWVHIGLAPEGRVVRRQQLSIFRQRYLPGWIEKEPK